MQNLFPIQSFQTWCRSLPLFWRDSNETVQKIRKNSVENTVRGLSICDNLAAGVFFRILAGKKNIFKRKRPVSGQNHLHYSVYPKEVYHSSEIVGKERKPRFSGCLPLSFCQQITGSVPSFHSSIWMLNHSVPPSLNETIRLLRSVYLLGHFKQAESL